MSADPLRGYKHTTFYTSHPFLKCSALSAIKRNIMAIILDLPKVFPSEKFYSKGGRRSSIL